MIVYVCSSVALCVSQTAVVWHLAHAHTHTDRPKYAHPMCAYSTQWPNLHFTTRPNMTRYVNKQKYKLNECANTQQQV